jgi:hypothetical protein
LLLKAALAATRRSGGIVGASRGYWSVDLWTKL